MKLLQFTHGDLDGAACAVAAARTFADVERDVRFCQYGDGDDSIDAAVREVLQQESTEKRFLLITDICPSKDVCDEIDRVKDTFEGVLLVDHHETNAWALDYSWTKIDVDNLMCGARLLLEGSTVPDELLLDFVYAVDAYDRWQLQSEHRARGEALNRLYWFLGPDRFVREFEANPGADRDTWLSKVAPVLRDQENHNVSKLSAQFKKDSDGRKIGFLVTSENVSKAGNVFLTRYPELEYVVVAVPRSNVISLRSRDDGVNVADIAKEHGGGGHAAAAGFPFDARSGLWDAVKDLF